MAWYCLELFGRRGGTRARVWIVREELERRFHQMDSHRARQSSARRVEGPDVLRARPYTVEIGLERIDDRLISNQD